MQQVTPATPQGRRPVQMAQSPMPPSRNAPPAYDLDEYPTGYLPSENGQGQNGKVDAMLNPESLVTTSKAAENWRESWLDRQHAEAGPAEEASRGQAVVPMPLVTMQKSFARMRAIAASKQQNGRSTKLGFWITIFLMVCLTGGLGAYIISTFLPNSPFGAEHVVPPANSPQPSLVMDGSPSQSIAIGQAIHLHGEHFSANDSISFLLDTTIPIADAGGNKIVVQANGQGAFDAAFATGSDWTAGSHTIEAIDSSGNQSAYVTVQVIPNGTPVKTSTDLSLTMHGKHIQQLAFQAVIGQGNPDPQPITITNTSGAPLRWTAAASTGNNLSWLVINDNHDAGLLAISQPDTMLISVNVVGLKSTAHTKPYRGQIVFTINDNQLLTLAVQLQILDTTPEMVFSPDPIVAPLGPGNTCTPGVTLTLINLSTDVITWAVSPDDNIKGNIKFTVNGQVTETGTLQPSGITGDTQVLTVQCNAVRTGHQYHVTVSANGMSWSELVIIQG